MWTPPGVNYSEALKAYQGGSQGYWRDMKVDQERLRKGQVLPWPDLKRQLGLGRLDFETGLVVIHPLEQFFLAAKYVP